MAVTNPADMHFRAYANYKNSGVEWLAEIPSTWTMERLKIVAKVNPRAGIDLPDDAEVSFVPMECVGEYGGLQLSRVKRVSEVRAGYTLFKEGDVVVAKITPCFENGKGARAEGLTNGYAAGTTELHVLRAGDLLDPQYLLYLTFSDAFRSLGTGEMYGAGGQQRVPERFVEEFPVPLPPFEEQRAIVTYLNQEVAKIDALVGKKELLVQLLEEKRAALIARAVTAGLDPNVPMTNSGVEWLGKIPASWSVVRSKTLFRHRKAKAMPGEKQLTASQKYGVIPQGEFMAAEGRRVVQVVTGAEILKHVEPNDFVISMRSFQGGIEWSRYAGAVSSAYVALAPGQDVYPPYYAYLLKCTRYIQALQSTTDLVRDGQALRFENFAQVDLPWVPLAQQKAIAAFLDGVVAAVDVLVVRVHEAMIRLREYRGALVSAAVTGKIKVI